MTLSEFIDGLEKKIAKAVADEAILIASEIRAKVTPDRVKTRRGIKVKLNGTRAKVGIYFAERYPGTGTTTHDNFRKHWQEIRPKARRRLIARINNIIHEG